MAASSARPCSRSDPRTIRSPTSGRRRAGEGPAIRWARATRIGSSSRRYGFDARWSSSRRSPPRARGRPARQDALNGAAHDAVVRRAGDRAARAGGAARRAAASPSPRPAAFWLLAAALSFVDGRLVTFTFGVMRRRAGRHVPARQPARRPSGADRAGDRARRRGDRRLQRPRPHGGPASSSSRSSSGSPGSPASRCASGSSRPRRPRRARPRPSGSASPRPASPSPRSARGSRASSTTSSPTRSA